MDFGSYNDDKAQVASAIVNHLTPGTDGICRCEVPSEVSARRVRARQVEALAEVELSATTLAALVQLASQLRTVFESCARGDISDAARRTNHLLTEYDSAPVLLQHPDGPWHVHFHSTRAALADAWGAGCATALALLIGSGRADRLGVCTAAPCDRVFVDLSRNASRQHCSPRCTNRAGVAAHRSRKR